MLFLLELSKVEFSQNPYLYCNKNLTYEDFDTFQQADVNDQFELFGPRFACTVVQI